MVKQFVAPILMLFAAVASAEEIPNPLIDYGAFEKGVGMVGLTREKFRVTESEFIRMSRDSETVILDARSSEKFALLHVSGAKNLSLPDITEEELARIIPSKSTRVLIYCNNNFWGAPSSMPVKAVGSALNLSTFVSLHTYGYRNVYELGPVVDVRKAKLAFAGEEVREGL